MRTYALAQDHTDLGAQKIFNFRSPFEAPASQTPAFRVERENCSKKLESFNKKPESFSMKTKGFNRETQGRHNER